MKADEVQRYLEVEDCFDSWSPSSTVVVSRKVRVPRAVCNLTYRRDFLVIGLRDDLLSFGEKMAPVTHATQQ